MIDSRKSIWSWALYDWANSAFATTVMAGFFPLFFKAYWANQSNVTESTFYLGLANSTASIIVAAIAPFLGAIADRGTAKKKFLTLFIFLGVVSTGCLWMVQQGHWQLAATLYVLATIGFSGGNIFYDSLLPGVATKKKVDYASSLGFSLGYLGGGLLFAVNVFMFQKPALFGIPDQPTAIKLSFLSVAVWWAVFSIPVWLWVKEPKIYKPIGIVEAFRQGFGQIRDTLKETRHLKVVGLFLAAFWLYIDGVDTIIRMAVDYGISIGFPASSLILALLLVQFVAFPATLLFAWVAGKIGAKQAILFAIFAYSCITILGAFMTQQWHFYTLAVMIGFFQGGIQAISRSLYSRIIPPEKSAQFYGLYNMMGKFAAVIGPALMGTITLISGSNRVGILSILILFVSGFIILLKVNIKEGEEMAAKYLSS
ncbi:MFS transporter [bacterium]|nr:MFS transporter [bacterium]